MSLNKFVSRPLIQSDSDQTSNLGTKTSNDSTKTNNYRVATRFWD